MEGEKDDQRGKKKKKTENQKESQTKTLFFTDHLVLLGQRRLLKTGVGSFPPLAGFLERGVAPLRERGFDRRFSGLRRPRG